MASNPDRAELVRIIAATLDRADRAQMRGYAAIADMVLRDLKARRVRLVLDRFDDDGR